MPYSRYNEKVKARSFFKFLIGLVSRLRLYIKYDFIRRYVRLRGAEVGENSILSWKLAKRANQNLIVGRNSIIEAWDIDLRGKVFVGDNVIINRDVTILRVSHYIDDNTMFSTRYYPDLQIEQYVWLCTGCRILPSVTTIAEGTVVGAYSLLTKNTTPMGVYAGNPASLKRTHSSEYEELVVPSLMGGICSIT